MTEQTEPLPETGTEIVIEPEAEPLAETETADLDALAEAMPVVGIVVGAEPELAVFDRAAAVLEERDVLHETRVLSAEEEPDAVADYCRNARMRGLKVLIAAAGASPALPGAAAAHTDLPVIGVPRRSDGVLELGQQPQGKPVACVGLDDAGNAAHLALRILNA